MLALAIEFSRCPRARTLKAEQRVPIAPKRERTASDRPGVSRYLEMIDEDRSAKRLLRKEVIQPHLPVRLPCYDFTPIASPTFDGSLHKG